MKRILFLGIIAIGLLGIHVSGVNAQSKTVDGEWDASMNTPGGPVAMKMTFKVDGEKLTGKVKSERGELAFTGTIKGSDINFSYDVDYNGNNFTLSYAGKVTGDTMGGTVSFGGYGEDQWNAKRIPPAAPKAN
jgi:hypothetical protein